MALLAPMLLAWSLSGTRVHAQARKFEPAEVKAAFLFNFTKFVEWPPDAFAGPATPIVIAVVGEDPFGRALDQTVAGETVNGRPLAVKRFAGVADMKPPCHLLYISSSEKARLPEILAKAGGYRALTVGEMDRFTQRGGAIRLRSWDHRVGFDVNAGATDRAGIKISSQLLKLAHGVRR